MATIRCPLGKRGRPSHEWNDGVKDRIYCYGWTEKTNDELLPECKKCVDHVDRAQGDYDEWRKRNNGLGIARRRENV